MRAIYGTYQSTGKVVDVDKEKEFTRSSGYSSKTCGSSPGTIVDNLKSVMNSPREITSPEKRHSQGEMNSKNSVADDFSDFLIDSDSDSYNKWVENIKDKVSMVVKNEPHRLRDLYTYYPHVFNPVVDGIIIPAVENGANWLKMVSEYHIHDAKHYDSELGNGLYKLLQNKSVDFLFSDICNGAKVNDLTEKYSISDEMIIYRMERLSIRFAAAGDIEKKCLSNSKIAEKFGITSDDGIHYLDSIDTRRINKAKGGACIRR